MLPWTLVTGASGFVGSRLVRQLVERGQRVKALVRAGSSLRQLQGLPEDRLRLEYGDITVMHSVYAALAGCDRMYHVASNFKLWDRDPENILRPAVEGTRATLTAAKKRKLQRVVVTSSVATLGSSRAPEPMDEQEEFHLANAETYVRSKYQAEQVAHEFAAAGLPVVIVLPSAIVGPGDWKPTPTGQSIVRYMRLSPMFRAPVTEGGMNIVDVDDVVSGHMLAMERGRVGERYILGGENLTFEQMLATLSELTALAPPGKRQSEGLLAFVAALMELRARWLGGEPLLTPRMVHDYAFAYAWVTSEKAERELGYTHRPAREALLRSVRWFLQHGYVPDRAARRVRLQFEAAG